ncbi:hypothetical protein BDD12DRAFT_404583 [Trichophaea hybrida]|nr:hypothetical protein BDD12DRAFT_404583 [Trichophaea hybrida]
MASETSYVATGLYSSDGCSSASLVHCSIETSLFSGFEVSIQLGMLFQNNNPYDMEDTVFHCKLDSEDSAMTSFSCCVERCFIRDPEARFERRMVKRAAKKGASFQCGVGNIPSGGDVILFISWVTTVTPAAGNEAQLLVPLPAEEVESSYCLPNANATSAEFKEGVLLLTFELDPSVSDLGLDDDDDDNYSSSEEYGPGTPAFEPGNPFDGDDQYHTSFQKTSSLWKSPVLAPMSDDMNQANPWSGQEKEEEEYHYQCLAPPPARRLHPFLELSSAYDDQFDAKNTAMFGPQSVPMAHVIDIPRHVVSLDHV